MNLKHYKLEIMVTLSLLFAVLGYGYKLTSHARLESSKEALATTQKEIAQIIALQELWGDKKLTQKLKGIEPLIDKSKVSSFKLSGKKLTASFDELDITQLNRLSNKIVALAVEIKKFKVTKVGERYRLELTCKW